MILSYGNILFIVFIIIVLFFIFYLLLRKSYLGWDSFKISQLEYFITHNTYLYSDYNFLTKSKKECFYNNFTKNIPYKDFSNILDIRIKSKTYSEKKRNSYLDNNNEYQTFILNTLKYISQCFGGEITSEVVCIHLNDKIKENTDICPVISDELNKKGYTLNQFTYLDKFYINPEINPSNAPVIKDFVNLLNSILNKK